MKRRMIDIAISTDHQKPVGVQTPKIAILPRGKKMNIYS
jgi:hypothetical protein